MIAENKKLIFLNKLRLPDGLSPYFTSRPKIIQTKDSLMIQLAVSANLTPSASWFLGHKNLEELGSNFSSKMERKSIDNYLLSMEIQVKTLKTNHILIYK